MDAFVIFDSPVNGTCDVDPDIAGIGVKPATKRPGSKADQEPPGLSLVLSVRRRSNGCVDCRGRTGGRRCGRVLLLAKGLAGTIASPGWCPATRGVSPSPSGPRAPGARSGGPAAGDGYGPARGGSDPERAGPGLQHERPRIPDRHAKLRLE